jgi:hypothetical protein
MKQYYRPTAIDLRVLALHRRAAKSLDFGSTLMEAWKDSARDRRWACEEIL